MPPRPKFTREKVIETALDITRDSGIDAVTAKELGKRLHASASPLFTLFSSIDEIRDGVREKAMDMFTAKSMECTGYTPAFKQFGLYMIAFAKDEPELFKLLFMEKRKDILSFIDFTPELCECFTTINDLLREEYGLSEDESWFLFNQMWIYTYGISTFCACGVCSFTDDDLNTMLGQQFTATIRLIKSGNMEMDTPVPVKKETLETIPPLYEALK